MRKLVIVLALTISMLAVVTVPVGAATLGAPHVGTMCPGGFATLHFVNNQTGGAASGFIKVTSDVNMVTVMASSTNKNVQHFDVVGLEGTVILSAFTEFPGIPGTDIPGKLVLSDFTCDPVKKAPSKKAPSKKG